MSRPSWDRYFLKMAMLVSERSTCRRHHVGAVLVREGAVIATGFNQPIGNRHADRRLRFVQVETAGHGLFVCRHDQRDLMPEPA